MFGDRCSGVEMVEALFNCLGTATDSANASEFVCAVRSGPGSLVVAD